MTVAQEVTQRILAQLKAGVCPWRQPWTAAGSGSMPRNHVTGRAYSGVNVLLLWMRAEQCGYTQSEWLTYKQAQEADGQVRKGEKGVRVVFVSTFEREGEDGPERVPFLKPFTVFNVAQCDGLVIADESRTPVTTLIRDEAADAFIVSTGASIRHGEGRAYYRPSTDSIMIPDFETFSTASAYYATVFHELAHWTGAPARLDRTFGRRFGDHAYAVEELVAELTSAFCCAELGIENAGADASYIAHWLKFLSDHDTAILTAASQASRAVDFLRHTAQQEAAA